MSTQKIANIVKNFLKGSLRCAEFALDNACIAKCSFCNIWRQKPKVFVEREKALFALERLADFGVVHICFTGGEALLHPNVTELVERATKLNINSAMLVAAPSLLLRKDMIKRLEAAGTDLISISFDSDSPRVMEDSRQIPGIMDELKSALEQIKKTKLKTMASVLIWNGNFDRLAAVCEKAVELGFDFISLNYPTFSESATYELGGEGITLSKEELIRALEAAMAFKKAKKYKIVNLAGSMRNIADYLRNPATAKYHCFGGRRVMFVDWFFDVYPCMQLAKPLGNLMTMEQSALNIPACNRCNMSWYRDMSCFFHGIKSLPLLIEAATDLELL